MESKNLLIALVILQVIALALLIGTIVTQDKSEIDLTDQNIALVLLANEITGLNEKIDNISISEDTSVDVNYEGDYMLSKQEYEDKISEEKAVELALESVSLENKDFKEALYDALVNFSEDIDSYRDITKLTFEYDVDGDNVTFDKVKVYYFIDDDEDEAYKARIFDFDVEVEYLDFDDEFEDTEVNEDYFTDLEVKKVYDL